MASALKSRRSEAARPAMQDQLSGPPQMGAPEDDGGDKLAMIVQSLTPEDKTKLMGMLQAEVESPEGEAAEGNTPGQEDEYGQAKVSPGELAELKAEASNMFGQSGEALGEAEEEGPKPRGLGDRFKASLNKHFKK